MTEKQQNILKAALKLFANEGYANTSTSKVAKAAGVSEGLIFRHFKNKEGLLQAVLAAGHEKAKMAYAEVLANDDPKVLLRKVIELPFLYPKDNYEV
ncbi:MAG: helix-turn-helix domain-containing protein, partial [Bacteroidota bacterium]